MLSNNAVPANSHILYFEGVVQTNKTSSPAVLPASVCDWGKTLVVDMLQVLTLQLKGYVVSCKYAAEEVLVFAVGGIPQVTHSLVQSTVGTRKEVADGRCI